VNTICDLEATSFAPTTHAPQDEQSTVASAWSSSPLGNPADDGAYSDAAGFIDEHHDFPLDPTTSVRKRRFLSKGVMAGGLIAAVGLSAALGLTLLDNSKSNQTRPLSATSGATAAPTAAPFASLAPAPAPAPAAPAPAVAAPVDIPAPAPVVAAPAYAPDPVGVPDSDPLPAAPPPLAPPPPPAVVVAPVVPVWVPPHPVLLPHPLNPNGPSHGIGCLPPHRLVQGVCH
jgi:hypothetical protein